MKLDELDFSNIGEWPLTMRAIVLALVFSICLIIGIKLDSATQLDELTTSRQREATLRKEFETKQQEAVSLPIYIAQMAQMRESLGNMLQKLPSKMEIPGLLEDISEAGIKEGLAFKLFKPSPEANKDFYAELPIQMVVTGNYHQIANFSSKIANLKRIVVLGNFEMYQQELPSAKNQNTDPLLAGGDNLELRITAKTYRYLDVDTDNE